MLILKHHWDKKKVRKLVDYLYTAKTRRDPMTQYMKNELKSEMLNFLLQNPSLFASYYFYQEFVEMYFPDFASEHPTYTSMLVQMAMVNDMRRRQRRHQRMYEINYQRLLNDTRQIRNDRRITHTMQLNVDLDRILRETTIDLTAQHEQTLERTINQLNKAIEKEGLINIPDIKKNKKLQEKLDKLNKQIERENKRLEKNKTNRVLWQKARLLDDKYKPTYKVWNQHPNPKTRHSLTDGQKVKLEEKFIVINDKTGDIDYVDYPGDWTCSPSNSANCLCSLSFTNDPTGYKPQEELNEEYKQHSEDITLSAQLKKILLKNSTHRKFESINRYVTQKQINHIYNRIKDQFPKEFSEQAIKEIIRIQQAFQRDANEHSCVLDFNTGKIYNTRDGKKSTVPINFSGIKNMENLASIHNHPRHGFHAPSDKDINNMLKRKHEKYCIVLSENKIWIVKNKYHNVDLKKIGDYTIFRDSLNMIDNIKNIFNHNKINSLDDINSIENINNRVDKDITNIFEEYDFSSKIINI